MQTQSVQFSDFPLSPLIHKAIQESGYTQPTPIQSQSIPQLLKRRDLLGTAQTGTGKTAAFALPILQNLLDSRRELAPKSPRSLVLAPTRELAIQIFDNFKSYGKHTNLKFAVMFGGVSQNPQVAEVRQGVDVLIATPGRLLDLVNQKLLNLSKLEILVLDEADRMLDMGFLPDIKKILQLVPKERQNLFFSATMSNEILNLTKSMLVDPIKVQVNPVSSTAELIQQSVMFVEKDQKRNLLLHLLQNPKIYSAIVFSRTKHGANRIAEFLTKNKIHADAIHGNKSQGARQRAIENFRNGSSKVLVATDIAARGIDIDHVSHVINYDLPADTESYVHRIGRTARAGSSGIAISFCDAEEKAYLKDIENLIRKQIPLVVDQPYHSERVLLAKTLSKGVAKAMIESGGRMERNQSFRRGGKPSSGGSGKRDFRGRR